MKAISLRSKLGIHALNIALLSGTMFTTPAIAQDALPTGGQVVAGSATIESNGSSMSVNQSSDAMIANWQSFSVGAGNAVTFNQPNAQSVALNRVIGQDPSRILGSLTANGKVFLVNPNGIVIGKGGSVQSGGFVGSTLDMKNADFLNGDLRFAGTGGAIVNQGDLKGGVVALIAPRVTNEGTITGDTALAGATDVTLDFDGEGLVSVELNASSLATMVENKGLIRADGGLAILTAKGANDALKGVVNNTGVVEAKSLATRDGRILLLGDMDNGEVDAAGTLEASFVETSAKQVNIADELVVNTNGGEWLIDPYDFTIAAQGGNITGTALSKNLASGNVTISTATQGANGDLANIFVNDGVNWSANKLTLSAVQNITINTAMNASGTAGLALEYAQAGGGGIGDYFIKAPVNIAASGSFSTKKGSDAAINYTIITSLGTQSSSGNGTLQGMRGSTGVNFALGANVSATATKDWNGGLGFTPIGSGSAQFQANFDGLGHTISNLHINRPSQNSVGLFGIISSTTKSLNIRNVRLSNPFVRGAYRVGGLAGSIAGNNSAEINFINIHVVNGDVAAIFDPDEFSGALVGGLVGVFQHGLMQNSSSDARVSGTTSVGGLVGNGSLQIRSASSSGRVTGAEFYAEVGGLVGQFGATSDANSIISDSYSMANVAGYDRVGGLVGTNSARIIRSYAAGAVSGLTGDVGGLVGLNIDFGHVANSVQNSFWDTQTTGQSNGCGRNLGVCTVTGLTTAQMKTTAPFTAAGWNFTTVWGRSSTINSGYPYLRANVVSTVTTTTPPTTAPTLTVNGIASSYTTSSAPYQPKITITGTALTSVTTVRLTWTDPAGKTGTVTWNAANNFGGGKFVVAAGGASATLSPTLVASGDPSGAYRWTVTFVAGTQSVAKNFTVNYTPVVTPPPPPPPVTLTVSNFGSITTQTAPYQTAIPISGTGLSNVTEVRLTWTDPNGQTGTSTWNAANNFGGGRFVVGSGGNSATISPLLLVAGDPSGAYQWTVTFIAGTQTVTRNFAVTYAPVVAPPPPPPPPLAITTGIGGAFSTDIAPYSRTFTLNGQSLASVTAVTLRWTDPTGKTGTVVWDTSDNFRGGKFSPAADGKSATLTPTLVGIGDSPGLFQWSIILTNGSQTIAGGSLTVTYSAAQLEEPVVTSPTHTSGTPIITQPDSSNVVLITPSLQPNRVTEYGEVKGQIDVTIDGVTKSLVSYSNANADGLEGYTSDGLDRQCVELIQRYAGMFTGEARITGLGNGKDVASNLPTATNGAFSYFPSGSAEGPVVGSVISINLTGALAPYGHVGIVQSVVEVGDTLTVTLFDQNWPTNVSGGWKTVTFTKDASGDWVGTMLNSGQPVSVIGWANPN